MLAALLGTRISVTPDAGAPLAMIGRWFVRSRALRQYRHSHFFPKQAPMPPISHDISRDPLMLIRAADSGEIPVVCLPGAGASVTTFLDFTEALGERWPIYGLQPRGIDASERPHESV